MAAGRSATRPGLDAQREVPAAIVTAQPAEAVALGGELERARRLERESQALEQFGLEPVHAAIGDGVLEARVFAIGAIAEVALDHDHGLGHLEHLVGREEADDVREARIGLRLAVRGAEAAAHHEVEAEQLALFQAFVIQDGDEAQILREDVHVVVRRHHDGRLELAR